jgi:hypothetical protein
MRKKITGKNRTAESPDIWENKLTTPDIVMY